MLANPYNYLIKVVHRLCELRIKFREYLHHKLNPLHIYCRLIDLNITKQTAQKVSTMYEPIYVKLAVDLY